MTAQLSPEDAQALADAMAAYAAPAANDAAGPGDNAVKKAERRFSEAAAKRTAVYADPASTDVDKLTAHEVMMTARADLLMAQQARLSTVPVELMKALHPTVAAEILDAPPKTLFLPNDHLSDGVAADRIFRHMGGTHELFRRGDAVVEINDENSLAAISPVMLQSRLNERGRKVRAFRVNDKTKELEHHAKRCGESTAKSLLATRQRNLLPHIKLVVRMPLLLEHNGNLVLTRPGYNEFCGVYVTGKMAVPTIPIEQAGPALHALLRDFKFTEPADNSRALAGLVAPALRMARLVPGDALIDAGEANESQTGKGYRVKIVRAIYGERAYTVTQKRGGVGSFDESLAAALFSGRPFVNFDNLRGRIDSTYLETILTAGELKESIVSVRVPHYGEAEVDIGGVTFQMTSNGIESTVDLANRLLVTRLLKQPAGYTFARYPEGDLLAHVGTYATYYLGCVHAVIQYWHAQGKPALQTDHSFRHWVGALDWIVQSIWGARPLLEGHGSALGRIADPGLSWLRQLALLVVQGGKGGTELTAPMLREICRDQDLMPPGTKPDANDWLVDTAIGRVLKRCFAAGDTLALDGIHVRRIEREEKNDFRTMVTVKHYVFG